MERRLFIAILLCVAVLYVFQVLFAPPPQPQSADARPSPASAAAPSAAATPSAVTPPQATDTAPSPGTDAAQPAPLVAEPGERDIVVETQTVQAVFTNRGGRLLHWRLKDYHDSQGQPVDLVPSGIPSEQPRPFALRVDDGRLTGRLNNALYRVSGDDDGRVDATTSGAAVTFEFEDASGLSVTKEFRFEPRGYVVTFASRVSESGRPREATILWGPGLGDIGSISGGGSMFTGNYVQPPQAIFHRDGGVERIPEKDLAAQPSHEGQFRFAGIDDHYFLAAVVNPGRARLDVRPLVLPGPDETARHLLVQALRPLETKEPLRFFIGPKQFDELRAVDPELVRAINFGRFTWLIVPLLNTLKWLYGYLGNYGWAIVVLTVLINLAIFPLRHKAMVAMRKMQEIQPQMKAIQARYEHLKTTDPARQKMNTEIMNLMRERGANPASGCVPTLLTMPVLFAFFSLLSQSIELRGAPFIGWISDLSAADPFYVLPALMGVTMFWQQKITPTSVDPAQQRVMMIMPVMFTAMMIFSPSGVVLYWFTSQVWAIGQQYVTNRLLGPPAVATVRPPAERRLKNAGSGRTAEADRKN